MGYRNHQMGYREGILTSRAVIKKENYAILPHDGLVKNVLPGFVECEGSILGSPRLGAHFVDYLFTLHKGGKTTEGFGGEDIEVFVYVIKGSLHVKHEAKWEILESGGYAYFPAGESLFFENAQTEDTEIFLYKKRYEPIDGLGTYPVIGNIANLTPTEYEGMKDVLLWDLLPKDLAFDMNMHILSFDPGASHGYIETHYQEHGAYVLSGKGMYNLDNEWLPIEKGDYLFMASYVPQSAYAVGRKEPFVYLYSKDCNRDPKV